MAKTHHSIDYAELAAPDLAAAQSFYAAAFGWAFHDYGGAYAGIVAPGRDDESGGLNPQGAGPPLVIVYSDDLDATLAAVRAAGGEVTVEPFDFPGGRRFHFADPAGNVLGVWSSA